MQVKDFCNQMEKLLSTFETSVASIEKILDTGGTKTKQPILPLVGDIKILLTELRLQKDRLERECPSDWSDEKSSMEDLVGQIGSHLDRAQIQIPEGNIGG